MTNLEELERKVDLLVSQHEIERLIYRMGYYLEVGDFAMAGELLAHATLGADRTKRKEYRGKEEIQGAYERTNIVYPEGGRRSKEIYTNVLVDIDPDANTATSVTSYTVGQQPPGEEFALLVAGKYEDEWERVDGAWRWTDRYIVVQYLNDLNKHMVSGTQPYN